MKRRIDHQISRTAEMTCTSRAISAMETDPQYHSADTIAPRLLPTPFRILLHIAPIRRFFCEKLAPDGIYEYVIARTKYIDAAYQQALQDGFDQILILGAGFDTRAVRFSTVRPSTRVFELDSPVTQQAKIDQYRKRAIPKPENLTWIPIDFDHETLAERLEQAAFQSQARSFFILEGLTMYLQHESVAKTLTTLRRFAGPGSRIVFDFVQAGVFQHADSFTGGEKILQSVHHAGELWHFGLDPRNVADFLAQHGFALRELQTAHDLEKRYFSSPGSHRTGRINATHCLVTAETC